MLAGPYCTMLLADLGCDVIKIESPSHPDRSRSIPGCTVEGTSAYFACLNRNKRSLALDLKDDAAREAFYRLVERSHVVVDNFRPGVTGRLGIDFSRLREHNPRIVSCSISGFGATGPRRDAPAYDYVIQALSGTMSLTGDPAGEPVKYGISIVDHTAGVFAAFGILAALRRAERTGEGSFLDASLLDTHLSMLTYVAADYLNCGVEPQRYPHSAHPYLVPSQLFRTRDGHIVVTPMADHMWQALCTALGLVELGADPELATAAGRLARREQVTAAVAAALAEWATDDALAALGEAGVPAAPVNTVAEALAAPQVEAREMVVQAGGIRMMGNPIRLGEQRFRPAPSLGEHTREILAELDPGPEELERLCPATS